MPKPAHHRQQLCGGRTVTAQLLHSPAGPLWVRHPHTRRTHETRADLVERTIAWLVRGNRRLPTEASPKMTHWLHHRAAAINLRRLGTLGLTHTGTSWPLA